MDSCHAHPRMHLSTNTPHHPTMYVATRFIHYTDTHLGLFMDSCYARPRMHLSTNTPHHPTMYVPCYVALWRHGSFTALTHTPRVYYGFSPCPPHACALCFIPGESTSILNPSPIGYFIHSMLLSLCIRASLIYSAVSRLPSLSPHTPYL
jgi:hypothetical protein